MTETTGVNVDCVHVACVGWESCRFRPEPQRLGPELPELIYDGEGRCWGRRISGRVWWNGMEMVTWTELSVILAGRRPVAWRRSHFPAEPWVGSFYGDAPPTVAAEREQAARATRCSA